MAPAFPTHRWHAITDNPAPWAVALAVFLLQLPLALNPGYYSHDELQWAYRAAIGQAVDWGDIGTFQYRPITFTVWMALSRALFAVPQAFHAVLVAWGAANAALLYAIGRRAGIDARACAVATLVFAMSPYAVVTHGWVGTIADLAWGSCALSVAWCALRLPSIGAIAVSAAIGTAVGLLAKEAALSIPLLATVAWLFTRDRRWGAATLGAWAAAIAYLTLRLPVLLAASDQPTLYAPKLANVVSRWVEYQLFTPMVRVFDAQALALAAPKYLLMSAVLWCAWFAATWRGSRRLAAFAIVAGGAALGPVLLLGSPWNHYGYAFAAVYALCGAAAWVRTARWGRMALGTMAVMCVLHGVVAMGALFEVGRVQAVFSPMLASVLRARPLDAAPVRLRPAAEARPWMFLRLTHEIPEYDGVPIGERVSMVGAHDDADFTIQRDGTLVPTR